MNANSIILLGGGEERFFSIYNLINIQKYIFKNQGGAHFILFFFNFF